MPVPKLILHPADPCAAPGRDAVVARLRSVGLIAGVAPDPGTTVLRAGDDFLSLVIFLGCSPAVATAPRFDGDEEFCHVRVAGPFRRARYRADPGGPAPRCPRCRATVDDGQGVLKAWEADPDGYRWHCPGCGTVIAAHELNWRQAVGFGRLFVEIWNVHNAEAVPGERLLGALDELTGGPWTYFYCRDLDPGPGARGSGSAL
jgi:hypothetical protein